MLSENTIRSMIRNKIITQEGLRVNNPIRTTKTDSTSNITSTSSLGATKTDKDSTGISTDNTSNDSTTTSSDNTSTVVDNIYSGLPIFSMIDDDGDYESKSVDKYSTLLSEFKSKFMKYFKVTEEMIGLGIEFANDDVLGFSYMLSRMINDDYDDFRLTRMLCAYYGGNKNDEEACKIFAVGEDHNFVHEFKQNNYKISKPSLATAYGTKPIYKYLEAYFELAQVIGSGYGDILSRIQDKLGFGPGRGVEVKQAAKNSFLVLNRILLRRDLVDQTKTSLTNQLNTRISNGVDGLRSYLITPYSSLLSEHVTINSKLLREGFFGSSKKEKSITLNAKFNNVSDTKGFIFIYINTDGTVIVSPTIKNSLRGGTFRPSSIYELVYFYSRVPTNITNGGNPKKDWVAAISAIKTAVGNNVDMNRLIVARASKVELVSQLIKNGRAPGVLSSLTTIGSPPGKFSSIDEKVFLDYFYNSDFVFEALSVSSIFQSIMDKSAKKDPDAVSILAYIETNKQNIIVGKGTTTFEDAMTAVPDPKISSEKEGIITELYQYMMELPEFSDSANVNALKAEMQTAINTGNMNLEDIKGNHPRFQKAYQSLVFKKLSRKNVSYDDVIALTTDFDRIGHRYTGVKGLLGLLGFVRKLMDMSDVGLTQRHRKAISTGGNEIYIDQYDTKIVVSPSFSLSDTDKENILLKFSNFLNITNNFLKKDLEIDISYDSSGNFSSSKIKSLRRPLGIKKFVKNILSGIYSGSANTTITIKFPAGRYLSTKSAL